MTALAEVRARVEHIGTIRDDDEAAHVAEKMLWRDVLAAIANGAPDAPALAAAALLTDDIEFSRWYA